MPNYVTATATTTIFSFSLTGLDFRSYCMLDHVWQKQTSGISTACFYRPDTLPVTESTVPKH